MKIWSRVVLKDRNRDIEKVARSFTRYLYEDGPMIDIALKYHLSLEDLQKLNQYTASRVAGLLMLYFSKNYARINDIANKYSSLEEEFGSITPEIEGYIDQ